MRISDQQHRILDAVRRDPKGWASNIDLHTVLFGSPEQREQQPLTPSQRASLSKDGPQARFPWAADADGGQGVPTAAAGRGRG